MLKKQVVLFAILLITIANCQSWKILTNNDIKFKFDSMSIVQNDTLFVIESEKTLKIPIKDISNIWYKNPNVDRGLVGGCLGWILGGYMGISLGAAATDNYEMGGRIGVVLGTTLGYVIFSKSLGTKYKLSGMTIEQKVDKINYLILMEKYNK